MLLEFGKAIDFYRLTDIEEIDRNQHQQVDEGEHDEYPGSNRINEVWNDHVDGATGNRESQSRQSGSFASASERKYFGWIDPARRTILATINKCVFEA